jgi:hypothetical protein
MSVATTLPTSLIPRFALFIEGVRRAMGEAIERRHDELGPLSILLGNYLSATLRRLAALHARFAAGKLLAAPRARRTAAERVATEQPRPERRPPAIPPGPVLLTVFRAAFDEQLRTLLDDPEMRALLAASPRAGRLLRPLWRKLTPEPLPELLRLPRRRRPRPARPARPATAPPGLRLVTLSDGTTLWEPIPCLPFSPAPRWAPARAAKPPAPEPVPAPPPAARPAEWGRPAPREEPRIPWVMRLFER